MFEAAASPYLVSDDGKFRVKSASSVPPKGSPGKKKCKEQLAKRIDEISDLQRILYAHDRHAILLIFQAMDAAGKDSTIRAVMSGINPAGCQVFSFKQPTPEALDHDFLWRTAKCLPERGRIGIFNRSYYEEVLAVRVHPRFLDAQYAGAAPDPATLWPARYRAIREHERHLAASHTLVLKFWLNVSPGKQAERFLDWLRDNEERVRKVAEGTSRFLRLAEIKTQTIGTFARAPVSDDQMKSMAEIVCPEKRVAKV